jgi:hypothetical protein
MDQDNRNRDDSNLDEEMERDTEIRRDTQVRGSLGIPPSGGESRESELRDEHEAVPEFERDSDEDRSSGR